jgi:hypothetical protein
MIEDPLSLRRWLIPLGAALPGSDDGDPGWPPPRQEGRPTELASGPPLPRPRRPELGQSLGRSGDKFPKDTWDRDTSTIGELRFAFPAARLPVQRGSPIDLAPSNCRGPFTAWQPPREEPSWFPERLIVRRQFLSIRWSSTLNGTTSRRRHIPTPPVGGGRNDARPRRGRRGVPRQIGRERATLPSFTPACNTRKAMNCFSGPDCHRPPRGCNCDPASGQGTERFRCAG